MQLTQWIEVPRSGRQLIGRPPRGEPGGQDEVFDMQLTQWIEVPRSGRQLSSRPPEVKPGGQDEVFEWMWTWWEQMFVKILMTWLAADEATCDDCWVVRRQAVVEE
jgi:hypothetical protein